MYNLSTVGGKPHVIAIFDHMALWLNLANDTCKDASKLLALSICTELLFGIMLQLGGILPSHRKTYLHHIGKR